MVTSSRTRKSSSGSHGGLESKVDEAREAQAAAKSLQQFARRGRIDPERGDERLRELIIANSYRLIYKIIDDDEVHRVHQ